MIGIYKITSPSGKVYIGQTWNSSKRFSSYKILDCKCQTKLYNSLKKYTPENHTIEMIHILPDDITQDIMDTYEGFYMNKYRESGIELMNLREAGSRGKHSEESKRKMSEVWDRPPPSEAIKAQIANSLKRYYKKNGPTNSKKVIQMNREGTIIKIWDSSREAASTLGIEYKGISQVVNGHRPTYKDFRWKLK